MDHAEGITFAGYGVGGVSLAHPAFAQSDDEPSQKWSYVKAVKAEGVAFVGAGFYP